MVTWEQWCLWQSILFHFSLSLVLVFGLIWQGYWFMQTPKTCWSFHMNPLLNKSPHWTTKYFPVNKYWDINNICRAGQQAVQGSRSFTGASSPSARQSFSTNGDHNADCEIIVHIVTDQIPKSSPLTIISQAPKMCPAVWLLGVNYHLTGCPLLN